MLSAVLLLYSSCRARHGGTETLYALVMIKRAS